MELARSKDAQNACLADTAALRQAAVAVIGAGGLGCNIAVHLAGAGVGKITLCDHDTVSESNLNRQFFYTLGDIGLPKAQAAARFLSAYAPDCEILAVNQKITADNAEKAIAGCSLVILACDNAETRLAVNKVCVKVGTPLLDSGIAGACASVYLYIPGKSPCLNCLTDGSESADKRTVSAAAGVVGGYAAMAAIEFLSGKYSPDGELIIIDAVGMTVDRLAVKKSGECKICGGECVGK